MRKFIHSLSVANTGIWFAIRTQLHMRIHLIAAALACGISVLVGLPRQDWAILLLAIALVICAEMINTAIEQAVDLASPDIHPIAKTAKDVAAGAVLLAAIAAVVIGLILLGPPLWRLCFE
ncbi:diacylglycerol kinase family protein [Paenibacillus harenae]|nr:diacylglycerol kinase family protein [Paenibacillus harenae]